MKKPKELSPLAAKAWDRFLIFWPHLDALADTPALHLLAEKWAEWEEAHSNVVKTGMVVTLPNGWQSPNPFLSIRTKACAALNRMIRDITAAPAITEDTDDELVF